MSILSVTKLQTGNTTTDLTISTGNSATGGMVVQSNGNALVLQSNSTTNTLTLYSNGNIVSNGTIYSGTSGQSAAPYGNAILNTATFAVGGPGANYLAFGQYGSSNNYAQWIQSGWSNGAAPYNIILNPLGGNVGIGNSSPTNTLSVNGTVAISTNTLNLGSSTKAANGYTYLPNGLLMQWGQLTTNAGSTNTLSFSPAFTSNVYSLTFTVIGATSATQGRVATANSVTATGFTVWTSNGSVTVPNVPLYWMAIGV